MDQVDEQVLRKVLDVVREGIIVLDLNGTVIFTNQEVERIWGYTSDELVGNTLNELLVADESYQQAVGAEHVSQYDSPYPVNCRMEFHGRHKSGTTFPLEMILKEVELPERRLLTTIVRDLSTRRSAERYLAVEHAVNKILVDNPPDTTIIAQLLESIGSHFDWELGSFWSIDPVQQVLHCVQTWQAPSVAQADFASATTLMTFVKGQGLPGLVWMCGEPTWVPNMLTNPALPRYNLAMQAGLHAAFAFPIRGSSGILGVIEFFSRDVRSPDADLLATVTALGNQIGIFLERKRAQLAVEESDSRKRAIFDMALDCIVTIDAQGRIIEWNPAAEQTFGYQRQQVLGQPIAELIIPPSLRERHREGMDRYIKSGASRILGKRIELTAMRADGAEFTVELTVTQLPSEGPLFFTAFIRDITERKKTETMLLARERKQEAVARLGQLALAGSKLDSLRREAARVIADGLAVDYCLVLEPVRDQNSLLLTASVGRQPPTPGETTISLAPDTQAGYTLLASEPVIVEDYSTETRFLPAPFLPEHGLLSGISVIIQGHNRPLGVLSAHSRKKMSPTQDDINFLQAAAHILAMAIERKQAEESLRNREERFRFLVQNASDIITVLGPDGTILYESASVERILGYQPDELIGVNAFTLVHPDDLSYIARLFDYGLQQPSIVLSAEYRFRHKDGSWCLLESTSSNLLDHPAIGGVVINSRDITERRRADQALQQYADRLKHLRDLDRAVLAMQSPEDMAQAALRRLQELVPYQRASVMLLNSEANEVRILDLNTNGEGGSLRTQQRSISSERPPATARQAAGQQRPITAELIAKRQQLEANSAYINVPLYHQGSLMGSLSLLAATGDPFKPEHLTIARDVAAHLELTLQQARFLEQVRASHQRMQSLSRQLLQTQEQERRRISRELHDQVGQSLTAIKMNIQAVLRALQDKQDTSLLEETIRVIDGVLQEVRDLSLDLRPLVLDDLGLVSAVRWYTGRLAQRSGLQVYFDGDPIEQPLPTDVETMCFRVLQEALTNVVRYAQARSVRIAIQHRGESLYLLIRDDGIGFDVRAAQERAARGMSLGLLGMQERVELAGGQITIESLPMQGTEVRVKFPLKDSTVSLERGERSAG